MARGRTYALAFAVLVVTAGCQKAPDLTRDQAKQLIEATAAFTAPMDREFVALETEIRGVNDARREFLRLEGLAVKNDGPFGIAGKTATASFTWRWSSGPFAHRPFRSLAKLNCSSGTWKVYEDHLKHQLRASMTGEE
jgi:hypothetical protein